MKFKNRHRLKDKKIGRYYLEIKSKLGDFIFEKGDTVDIADSSEGEVILYDGEPVASFFDHELFPTIKGLLRMEAQKSYVTVDMGAVKFIYNGADVMAPGVVEVDEEISEGNMVWVKEMEHGKPLAIGRAMVDSEEMLESKEGKVVKNLHHVGDGRFD